MLGRVTRVSLLALYVLMIYNTAYYIVSEINTLYSGGNLQSGHSHDAIVWTTVICTTVALCAYESKDFVHFRVAMTATTLMAIVAFKLVDNVAVLRTVHTLNLLFLTFSLLLWCEIFESIRKDGLLPNLSRETK